MLRVLEEVICIGDSAGAGKVQIEEMRPCKNGDQKRKAFLCL